MVTTAVAKRKPVPWWVRSKAPWTGEIFSRMNLQPEDPEEERIQSIRETLIALRAAGPRLSLVKARIFTRVFQETEGMHPALRRALAAQRSFAEIPIDLMPSQLLMGTSSSGPQIADFTPELFFIPRRNLEEDAEVESPMRFVVERYRADPGDVREFEEEIWPYWRSRCMYTYVANEMRRHYPESWRFARFGDCYTPLVGGSFQHTIQDYGVVMRKGLLAIQEEIKARMAELDAADPHTMDPFERRNHYEAMLIVADGMITYANRNADLAEKLAAEEKDPQRAAELREMARICRRVPAYPAQTWWEAVQAFHFLRAGTTIAEDGNSHSTGRFDLYMYPFLEADLAAGRTTKKKAQEVLECFLLKWNETSDLKTFGGSSGGGNNNDKMNLGGMDANGRDATNPVSYMLLEAHAHVHLNDPNMGVRLHRNTPDDFLRHTLEVIRLGSGLPILINDEVIVPGLTSLCGVKLEHARHYGDIGCQENVTDPNMTGADANGRTNAGWFNLPKPIELALWNGVNPRWGVQAGPQTGDPRTFTSMAQFVAAVKAQVEYSVKMNVILNNVNDYIRARRFPSVFHNLMHPGPRATGKDISDGGCMYNWTGALGVGTANAGDILTAIDTLIYRQGEVTWDGLLSALQNNWEGAEDLRKQCIEAPKYGCDDEYADDWVKLYLDMWFDAYEQYSTPRGGLFVGGLISMGNYVTLGSWTGPTPDGRRNTEPLADSTSPSPYASAAGPTATHRSEARAIDAYRTVNGVTFNQKFNATAVMSARDVSKWADLVRSHVEAGGQEMQYTVVDRKTLQRAQTHPDEFRDLIVRVGGYSAIFVELSKEVQDTVIARAEQEI